MCTCICCITEELKHWPVVVYQCGDLHRGDSVFLGLSKYALLIVKGHLILQYHPFYSCEIELKTYPANDSVDISVNDMPWVHHNSHNSK